MSFNASLGAVDALVSSGRLALIKDPDLRLGLAGLRDAIVDASEEQLVARDVVIDHVTPLLAPVVDLSYVSLISDQFFAPVESAGPQERVRDRPLPSFGAVRIPSTLELRNQVMHRIGWLGPARTELASLALQIDELIELISLELG